MFFNEEATAKCVSENQRPPLVLGVVPTDLRHLVIHVCSDFILYPALLEAPLCARLDLKGKTTNSRSLLYRAHNSLGERHPNTDRDGERSQWIISFNPQSASWGMAWIPPFYRRGD